MKNRISECIQKSVEIFNTILCDEDLLQTNYDITKKSKLKIFYETKLLQCI